VDTCEWVLVEGGVCLFGDTARRVEIGPLWWTPTPVTSACLGTRSRGADIPVTGVTQAEAAAIAGRLGGRLPRSSEWEWMAGGPGRRRYPWGDADWHPGRAALLPSGSIAPVPAGTHPEGATPEGVLDVAGNVWEWTGSPVMGGGFVIRGGSYASLPLYAQATFLNAAPAELRSAGIGLRAVREP
jgi:formylglycine-generating enzyme